ncbi:TetR/AcrR family transcriptional regulator [Paenibacillus sp. GCM10012307]
MWKENLDQHRTQRREDIINTAKSLFMERSLTEVTLKDIVEACGISKVTFYKYFTSIDEIIFEVEIDILSQWVNRIRETKLEGSNSYERLAYLLKVQLLEADIKMVRFTAMFDTLYQNNYPTPELEKKFRAYLQGGSHPFVSLIQSGIQDGSMRQDMDAREIGYTISNIVMASLHRNLLRGKLLELDQKVKNSVVMQNTMDMILNFVKVPSETQA